MTAQEALNRFRERAAAGQVIALKSGGTGPIGAATQAAIETAFRAAITFAAQKSNLDEIPFEAYADALDQYAVADAQERGLRDAAGMANKCRRFVATVDGRVRERRRSGEDAVPEGWLDLYRLLRDYEHAGDKRARRAGSLAGLAQAAVLQGIRTPYQLPPVTEIRKWTLEAGTVSERSRERMLSAYRLARKLHLQEYPGADLPDIDRCPVESERGIRSLPDIVKRLEAVGYTGPINAIEVEDVIRLLAPNWYTVMKAYIEEYRRSRGRQFPKKVIGASSRFLATLVETGHGDLETAHPTPLLLKTVDTGEVVEEDALGGDEWAEEFYGSLGVKSEDESEAGMATRQIRLFAALAYETANESAKNSPLVLINDDGESDGPPFWTFSVIEDTRLIGELGLYAGRTTKLFRQRPALAQDAEAAVKEFLRSMRTANSKKSLDNRKGKERLLNLVTFPMVLCLGIPALRRRALTLRDEWYAAMLRHRDRHDHPQILRTEEAYDRALTGLMVFSVITADGLRLANYTGARLGHLGRERMVEDKAPDGTVIRSYCHIHPVLNASKNGLVGIETNFYGDDNPSVKLKIDKVPGSDEWRQHPHWLRPGIVDMELMWDYLTRTRAKRLAQQGLIASAEEYDIERDINEWHFALFISDTPSSSAYESATGAYTHQAVSDIYGRMLHWICTEVLGRELPEYGQQLKRLYRAVFSAHSSRLLAGTHLYGVLQRETEAATLLNDTRRIVERRYSVAEASMIHKRGWEHPRFFDDLFKRIWDENESVDWDREDPLKDIPAHDRPRPFESAA